MSKTQEHQLPIARTTAMITVRHVDGREVFTYADMAAGLQVSDAIVRRQFSRNAHSWNAEETGVCHFDLPSGTQEVRWFTARGAMRFCRYVKSGRSDALFSHLLDLWEAQRGGSSLAPSLSEVDKLAMVLQVKLPEHQAAIAAAAKAAMEAMEAVAEQERRLAAVEEEQRQKDPVAIERRMFRLHQIKKHLVEWTKESAHPVTFRNYWGALAEVCKVGGFQNRQALTIDLMEQAITHAINWCFARGTTPPPPPPEQADLFPGGAA